MERGVRVAIVNDYEMIVAAVAAFLRDERIEVVELAASLPVVSNVDIVLYDTFGQVQGDRIDLEDLVRDSGAKVVIFSWNMQPDLVELSLGKGACGYLSKALTGPEIVAGLERVAAGETVVLGDDGDLSALPDWPGRSVGLTDREAEVLALITQGLSNQEIALQAYLSINSVKSHIRTAYRKIGVSSRSRAVLWGVDNGFVPDIQRITDPHHHRQVRAPSTEAV
jgi:DNA-binding NarL/FixJ family response regulator